MDIKVNFFEENFVEAIGAGIYGVHLQTHTENKELLYVGESVFVLVRCATHLYEIVKGNGYFGFTKEKIESNNITLVFELLVSESDKKRRKTKEKEIIKDRHPRMQSEISDRVKSVEDMISELKNLLNNNEASI